MLLLVSTVNFARTSRTGHRLLLPLARDREPGECD